MQAKGNLSTPNDKVDVANDVLWSSVEGGGANGSGSGPRVDLFASLLCNSITLQFLLDTIHCFDWYDGFMRELRN